MASKSRAKKLKRKRPADTGSSKTNGSSEPQNKKAKANNGNQTLPFLSLPAEIRNEIYHYLLVRDTSISICETVVASNCLLRQYSDRPGHNFVSGSLLRTCKTVHADASAMLYSNTFGLGTMQDLARWLRMIGPNAVHLRRIKFFHHVQAASFEVKPRCPKMVRGNQCSYRIASRQVAAMLADSEHLEPLKMKFRYTTAYQDLGLTHRRNNNAESWVRTAWLLAEMVHHDFRPLLRQALSRGKSMSEACGLIRIHRGNFLDRYWWMSQPLSIRPLNEKQLKDARDALMDHLQHLLRMEV